MKGDVGDPGPIGPKGDPGEMGDRGPEGDLGAKGLMGNNGTEGPTGETGEEGLNVRSKSLDKQYMNIFTLSFTGYYGRSSEGNHKFLTITLIHTIQHVIISCPYVSP